MVDVVWAGGAIVVIAAVTVEGRYHIAAVLVIMSIRFTNESKGGSKGSRNRKPLKSFNFDSINVWIFSSDTLRNDKPRDRL